MLGIQKKRTITYVDSEVKKWKNINFGDVRGDVRGGIIWKLGGKEREDQKEKNMDPSETKEYHHIRRNYCSATPTHTGKRQ